MESDNQFDISLLYERTAGVIGKENIEKIKKANICIIGLGGVGSYTLEALCRSGVGNLTVIDKDKVEPTNINRQLVASWYTVGMYKADVAKVHIETINPNAKVVVINEYIDPVNVNEYINSSFDYVIDAIDSIASKVAIIKRCKELNIPVISSMGMAKKIEPLKIKVADISKTSVCPLARIMRKRLKELDIHNVKVVYSEEEPVKSDVTLGSISFVPGTAGLVIAAEVIKDLISDKN